ncbi:rapid alkalinization factor-like [Elaeis guineensis]|uniref:rapid alkalinization factor-like n=1 Tax=Elaeis guineensis var. tenera TaxID=51953 RepID=UPI003C6D5AC8
MKPKLTLLWLLSVAVLFSFFELPVIHGAGFRVDSATCNASIGECRAEDEFLLDSETNRRILQQGRGIGYGSLDPDRQVCNAGRGQPYRNCLPPPSNAPHRGCEKIYGCRGGG